LPNSRRLSVPVSPIFPGCQDRSDFLLTAFIFETLSFSLIRYIAQSENILFWVSILRSGNPSTNATPVPVVLQRLKHAFHCASSISIQTSTVPPLKLLSLENDSFFKFVDSWLSFHGIWDMFSMIIRGYTGGVEACVSLFISDAWMSFTW
jgi:hypothetical protein